MPEIVPHAPKVLLVEDEALLRELIVEKLTDSGFRITDAPDGAGALAAIDSDEPFDILVSDIKLPDLDGYTVAEAGMTRRPGLKLILMTGYAPSPLPSTLADEVHQVLQKPFALDELVRAIGDALGR